MSSHVAQLRVEVADEVAPRALGLAEQLQPADVHRHPPVLRHQEAGGGRVEWDAPCELRSSPCRRHDKGCARTAAVERSRAPRRRPATGDAWQDPSLEPGAAPADPRSDLAVGARLDRLALQALGDRPVRDRGRRRVVARLGRAAATRRRSSPRWRPWSRLGTSYGQRLRRVAEVTVGVALGVFGGDLLVRADRHRRLAADADRRRWR